MIYQESYVFVLALSTILAAPIGLAMRTLLVMKERVIVPILRVRTATGDIQAITYQRVPSVHRPASRFRYYIPATPAKFTQSRRNV
jgi:hypothetical protein